MQFLIRRTNLGKNVPPQHSLAKPEILKLKIFFLCPAHPPYPRQICPLWAEICSHPAASFPSRAEQFCLPPPGANLIN